MRQLFRDVIYAPTVVAELLRELGQHRYAAVLQGGS